MKTMDLLQEAFIECPWCGESFSTQIDTSSGDHEHIEDCTVCCSPILVSVECTPGEIFSLDCSRP